jgi:hypothetical protein
MAVLARVDEPHAAVTAIDASFEHVRRRRRRVLHNRHQQKDQGNQQKAGNAGATQKGDVHKQDLLLRRSAARKNV